MCGITGIVNLERPEPIGEETLRGMLGMLRHRGPDEFGIYASPWAGLGSARLSILDLSGGQQPISNEDQSLWIVYNGEVFNTSSCAPRWKRWVIGSPRTPTPRSSCTFTKNTGLPA